MQSNLDNINAMLTRRRDVRKSVLRLAAWCALPFVLTPFIALAVLTHSPLLYLELTVSRVSFEYIRSDSGPFLANLPARLSVTLKGFQDVELPFRRVGLFASAQTQPGPRWNWLTVPDADSLRLKACDTWSGVTLHHVQLDELKLERGARVTIRATTGTDRRVLLTVDDHPTQVTFRFDSDVPAELECYCCGLFGTDHQYRRLVDLTHMRLMEQTLSRVSFISQKGTLILDLEAANAIPIDESGIEILGLAFDEEGVVPGSSIITDGKIALTDVGNREIIVRERQLLTFAPADRFHITRLALNSRGIRLMATGRAHELVLGNADNSELPSLYEWLLHSSVLFQVIQFASVVGGLYITVRQLAREIHAMAQR